MTEEGQAPAAPEAKETPVSSKADVWDFTPAELDAVQAQAKAQNLEVTPDMVKMKEAPTEPAAQPATVDGESNTPEAQNLRELTDAIKAYDGDEALQLNPHLKLRKKADGQEREVTLGELLEHYAFDVAYKNRLTEVDKDRQALAAEKESWSQELTKANETIGHIAKLAKENPLEAYQHLLAVAGESAEDFEQRYMEQNRELVEKYNSMSDEERNAYNSSKRFEMEKKQLEAQKKQLSEQQQKIELQSYLDGKKAETGLDDETINDAWQYLASQGIFANSDLSATQIVDTVFDFVDREGRYELVEDAMDVVNPELKNNQTLVKELVNSIGKDFTKEDVIEVLKQSQSTNGATPPAENLSTEPPAATPERAGSKEDQGTGNWVEEFAALGNFQDAIEKYGR